METMYDRLGNLLNETLENGKVKFVKVSKEKKEPPPVSKETESFFTPLDENIEAKKANRFVEEKRAEQDALHKANDERLKSQFFNDYGKYAQKGSEATIYKNYEYKTLTPEVESALKLSKF